MSLVQKRPACWCPLSVNPFPDVRRTVPEFDAPTFAEYQEIDRSAVDHSDLLEIDDDGSPFLIDRGTKDVHVVTSDSPADAQDHKAPFNHESVDSAGHGGLTARQQTERHSQTIGKAGKTGGAVNVELRILRILRN
jgi:hypothetical protein